MVKAFKPTRTNNLVVDKVRARKIKKLKAQSLNEQLESTIKLRNRYKNMIVHGYFLGIISVIFVIFLYSTMFYVHSLEKPVATPKELMYFGDFLIIILICGLPFICWSFYKEFKNVKNMKLKIIHLSNEIEHIKQRLTFY
jgi:hypothetical protein